MNQLFLFSKKIIRSKLTLCIASILLTSCQLGRLNVSLAEGVGYIDKAGHFVVQPKFVHGNSFSEGLAAVAVDSAPVSLAPTKVKWGYIDKTGKYIIEPQFEKAYPFHGDIAIVGKKIDKSDEIRYGFIDKTGKYIIQAKFMEARPFYGEVNQIPMQSLNSDWEEYSYHVKPKTPEGNAYDGGLAAVQIGNISTKEQNKWGYINRKGTLVINADFCYAGTFYEGLALVKTPSPKGDCIPGFLGKWGYINTQGKFLIKPQFQKAGSFHDGLAWVVIPKAAEKSSEATLKYGFINKLGKLIIPPQFENVTDFSEELAAVNLGKQKIQGARYGIDQIYRNVWGYIDKNGKYVIPAIFDEAEPFRNGLARISTGQLTQDASGRKSIQAKVGFIDNNGRDIISPKFDGKINNSGDFYDGFAKIYAKGKCGYIDKLGRNSIELGFDICFDFKEKIARVAVIESAEIQKIKFCYIDSDGRYIVKCSLGSESKDFSEGLAAVDTRKN
jgi:WG containing repeat